MKQTFSVAEAAEILGVAKGTLYHLCQRGQFPSVRLGRRVVIPKWALAAVLPPEAPEAPPAFATVLDGLARGTIPPDYGTDYGTVGDDGWEDARKALQEAGICSASGAE